jgi:hypothetical protein
LMFRGQRIIRHKHGAACQFCQNLRRGGVAVLPTKDIAAAAQPYDRLYALPEPASGEPPTS